MPVVVGVSFRRAGRVYHFSCGELELKADDWVLAQTSRGLELGQVRTGPTEVDVQSAPQPLQPILRRATEEDWRRHQANQREEEHAWRVGLEQIAAHGLPMKLVEVSKTFDGARIVFHFVAEGRVDFRALVRDLARALHTRVELHQLGVRDEAKFCGGLGPCGRELCCATFLTGFSPVAIRMAKDQDLSPSPAKISGLCGRLMCCLNFEREAYTEVLGSCPRVGTEVRTPEGEGRVTQVSVPKETVTIALHDGGRSEIPIARFLSSHTCLASDRSSGCDTCRRRTPPSNSSSAGT